MSLEENEETEINKKSRAQSENENIRYNEDPLNQNFQTQTSLKRSNELPPVKNKKMSKTAPSFSSNNNSFPINLFEPPELTSDLINTNKKIQEEENLKQELIFAKMDLNKKNQELYEFKILFKKQLDDNKYNKKLIEKILKIDPNKPCSKTEARDKVENAKPNEEERNLLKEAHESILLKNEILECKKEYNEKFEEYEKIVKNAKVSNIIKLNSEITLKEEDIRKLNRKMKQMQKQLNLNEKIIEDLKNEYEYYKNNMKEVKKNMDDGKKEENKIGEKYEEKVNEIQELEKKLSIKIYEIKKKKEEDDKKKEIINNLQRSIKLMDDFNEAKEGLLEKKNEDEKNQKDKEEELNKLKEERDKLKEENKNIMDQYNNNNEERKKLKKDAIEPKKNIQKMKDLKMSLNIAKETEENLKKENEKKNLELQNKYDLIKKERDEKFEEANKGNLEKEKLNKQIEELENKIKLISEENEKNKENIIIINDEIEKKKELDEDNKIKEQELKEKEKEEKEKEANDFLKELEEKNKEREKEIKLLKDKVEDLIYTNQTLEDENNRMKNDAEKDLKTLENFNELEEQLKQIESQLETVKNFSN